MVSPTALPPLPSSGFEWGNRVTEAIHLSSQKIGIEQWIIIIPYFIKHLTLYISDDISPSLQNRKGMYYHSHFKGEETKSQNILCIFT